MTRVILVEDNEMNARLLQHVLGRDGFEVTVFNSAEDAVARTANEKPDIILMDIQLPGMDGLEAARRIKADPATSTIPIIAITAHAMSGDRERIIEAGCEGYIAKPLNTREIPDQIRSYLKQ